MSTSAHRFVFAPPLLAGLCALLFTACTTAPPKAAPKTMSPEPSFVQAGDSGNTLEDLLAAHRVYLGLSRSDQSRRLDDLMTLPARPDRNLRLAFLLGMMGGAEQLLRAQALSDEVLAANGEPAARLRPLALLWSRHCQALLDAEARLQRQGQQLRDTQRRADGLAQQLDQLKAIEASTARQPPR